MVRPRKKFTQADLIREEWKKVEIKYFGDGKGGFMTPEQLIEKYGEQGVVETEDGWLRPLKQIMYTEVEESLQVPRPTVRRVVNDIEPHYFVKANNKYQCEIDMEQYQKIVIPQV
tara:strand:+ start:1303 stop:1647 length:345 start_codon:yes stop_codon:yes gene_type:complete